MAERVPDGLRAAEAADRGAGVVADEGFGHHATSLWPWAFDVRAFRSRSRSSTGWPSCSHEPLATTPSGVTVSVPACPGPLGRTASESGSLPTPLTPGFSQASGSGEINNSVGRVGALVADLLFNFFGRPAYLFTVMVFYFGWMIFREQKTREQLTKADFALRFTGFLATLVTSCALATLHFSPEGFRETAGGIVGQVVGGGMQSLMKLLGASVMLFFLWLASLSGIAFGVLSGDGVTVVSCVLIAYASW